MYQGTDLMAEYRKDESSQLWWCSSHQRQATHIQRRGDGNEKPHCDPNLSGILIPCDCVRLTGNVELQEIEQEIADTMNADDEPRVRERI